MSSVKLNPITDLGLSPDTPVPEMAEQLPRELEMDSVNKPSQAVPNNGLNGIMDLSSAKQAINKTPIQTVASTAPVVPASPVVNAAGSDASQPAIVPAAQAAAPTDAGSQIYLIAAFVVFLISLGAAIYFLMKYFVG